MAENYRLVTPPCLGDFYFKNTLTGQVFIPIIKIIHLEYKMPKISVLMTAYNSQEYIAEAIESILNQTFTDFEFIIINDGSRDSTADIIAEYAKNDKRIKFIDNKKNQGLISVLNQGLDLCTGEYIARMDSDDIAINNRLDAQVQYMDKNPMVGVVGCWVEKFGKKIKTEIRKFPSRATMLDILVKGTPVSHPGAMIRRCVLIDNDIRYNKNYLHAEDYHFWMQIIKVAEIHNLPMVLLKYRWHDMNISVVSKSIQLKNSEKIRSEIISALTFEPDVAKALSKMSEETITWFRLFGFLPIVRKKQYGIIKTKYYLFGKLPLLRVQDSKIYLFEFIQIGQTTN